MQTPDMRVVIKKRRNIFMLFSVVAPDWSVGKINEIDHKFRLFI